MGKPRLFVWLGGFEFPDGGRERDRFEPAGQHGQAGRPLLRPARAHRTMRRTTRTKPAAPAVIGTVTPQVVIAALPLLACT